MAKPIGEVLIKEPMDSGNSARIYVPKRWKKHLVKCEVIGKK